MTTLAEMRARVRDFVRDNNADPARWKVSDAELDSYLRQAVYDYSTHFPQQEVQEYAAPTAALTPPADMIPGESSVYQVEIDGDLWTELGFSEGESLPTSGHYWYWRGGKLTFPSAPTNTVYVWYRALYPFPATEDDAFTLPLADEELIELYAAAKFHQKLGTVAAKLDRFKEKGERDDSPVVLMHEVLMERYRELVADRKHRGSVRVRRSSR